jgi:hypothetical protein
MALAKTADELRAEMRARAQRTNPPLDDYDPRYFDRLGVRGGSTATVVRAIPAGWSPCECAGGICPDREVDR